MSSVSFKVRDLSRGSRELKLSELAKVGPLATVGTEFGDLRVIWLDHSVSASPHSLYNASENLARSVVYCRDRRGRSGLDSQHDEVPVEEVRRMAKAKKAKKAKSTKKKAPKKGK